ncbi:tripartite motif-containing protein 16-like [Girardinichthys multiradiatus]|uniref:tripartite motif-containing protein 16-like n=1 Tax=Girardinichthys multiradiatus TaxID=208333 RepID=UPI001FAE140F|nr:tripartite motif-containing protein 16-like [Girardinichthys multiradiatus]
MEQKMSDLEQENLSCSICLDLLKDPVTIPCGHSYCMNCIKDHWNGEEQRRTHSCPQCRKTFRRRPGLKKNITLAALVEDLKKTGLQADPADHCYAGPEDVACDVCTGRKMKAAKSCLFCPASYCRDHLQPHYDAPPLKKHKLVDPSKNLQENICSHHDEVMKIFCRTDQQCICYLCLMDEHKGHETVSAAAERTEKQQKLQDQEKDLKLLQQEVEAINVSADKAVEDSEKIFTEMIHLIQKRSSDVKQQIRSQQETEVSRVKDLQEKLEQEITELKRKDAEMKQLSNTEDHNQFLHNYPSLSALSESTHSSSINIRPLRYFEDVTAAVSELRDKLQDIMRDTWTNISLAITEVKVLLSEPEPTTRADFLKYSQEITLDPNTTKFNLVFSKGDRKMTSVLPKPSDVSDTISYYKLVLGRESLTGRCYWEVKWRGGGVVIGVSYKNISTGEAYEFNDKTWSLHCNVSFSTFFHKTVTMLPGLVSSRIGVYLNHRAGILSFYSISETMTLIHRVQTTFTQPLYAGAYVQGGSSVEFVKMK